MKLPKKIALLLTVTLVTSNVGALSFADTAQSVANEKLTGTGRWETAIEISKKGWTKATEAVIVNDASIADALAATPFADAKNAPILLTRKDSLNEKTKAELKRLGVKKVYIIGGVNTLTNKVEDLLKAENLEVDRIQGTTRELTALEIAKRLDKIKKVTEIAVVNGTKGLADAVSIAATAADKDMAIILSNPIEGTKASDEFIKSKNIKTSYVIGGVNSVSEAVKNNLPNAQRIEGKDRNETNAKVLEAFYTEKKINNAYIAKDGMGKEDQLIDALAVGVLAAKNDSPVIIVGNKLNEMQKDVTNTKSFKTVTQVGGNGNEVAFNELKTMQGVTTYEVKTVSELNNALEKADANDVINVRSLNDNARSNKIEISSKKAVQINLHATSGKSVVVNVASGSLTAHGTHTSIDVKSGELVIKGSVSTVNIEAGGYVAVKNEGTSKPNITVSEAASVEVSGNVNAIAVNGKDASISISNDAVVNKIEVSKEASGAVVDNSGKVDNVTSNAPNVNIQNSGNIGSIGGINKPIVDSSIGGTVSKPSTGSGSTGGGSTSGGTSTIKVNSVKLDKTEVEVEVGKTLELKATINPDTATNQNVTWKSSDTSVATVDQSGEVTGISGGTATITVTTEDGNKKATCVVKVIKSDKTIVDEEIDKYENKVIISNQVAAGGDITTIVKKLINGKDANTDVSVSINEVGDLLILNEDGTVTLNAQIGYGDINATENPNNMTTVVLEFKKGNYSKTLNVAVEIERQPVIVSDKDSLLSNLENTKIPTIYIDNMITLSTRLTITREIELIGINENAGLKAASDFKTNNGKQLVSVNRNTSDEATDKVVKFKDLVFDSNNKASGIQGYDLGNTCVVELDNVTLKNAVNGASLTVNGSKIIANNLKVIHSWKSAIASSIYGDVNVDQGDKITGIPEFILTGDSCNVSKIVADKYDRSKVSVPDGKYEFYHNEEDNKATWKIIK